MPYGGRHHYEIPFLLCCIEACEALLCGLFWFYQNRKQKGKRAYLSNKNILKIIMGRAMKMKDKIAFWGHRAEDGRVQPILAHLQGVSELARRFHDICEYFEKGKLQ